MKSRFARLLPRRLVVLVALILVILPGIPNAYSAQITLAWSPNDEPDLEGYRLFCREEGQSNYDDPPIWQGTATTCTTPDLDNDTRYCFVVRAFDTSGNESGDSNEACWGPPQNIPPLALAGPDQTANEGETVSLDGSNSYDPDGAITSYHWAQTSGTAVTLSDAASPAPTFTAPSVGSAGQALTFKLTVTDNGSLSDTDTVIINVSNDNQAPTADAGPDQVVDEGETVALNGSNSSDPDGSIVSYSWTQTAGGVVTLSDASAAQPTFSAPNVGQHGESLTFELTVTDNGGLQSTDSCTVNVVDMLATLTGLSVSGPDLVNESSTASYTATATFSDGSTMPATNSSDWSVEPSSYVMISNGGVLTTSAVPSDQAVAITASYTFGSVTRTAQKTVTIIDIPESNRPPQQPTIISPYDGQPDVSLTPELYAGQFFDPDGDAHGRTGWQVSRKMDDFSEDVLAFAADSESHLTSLIIPRSVLDEETTYYWRLRFFDNRNNGSEWSDIHSFTTLFTENDVDPRNGIPDEQEVDTTVDLDGNGTPDVNQNDIKCVNTVAGDGQIGVKADPSVVSIEAVKSIDPETLSHTAEMPDEMPLGVISFKLRVLNPGDSAEVTVYLSEAAPDGAQWYKYDSVNGWQAHQLTILSVFSSDRKSVTLLLEDGDYGDADGVQNCIIVDPGGIGLMYSSSSGDDGAGGGSGGSGGGGGCFISTIASDLCSVEQAN